MAKRSKDMATITLASGAPVETAEVLYEFVRDEAVTGTGWTASRVFSMLGELGLAPSVSHEGIRNGLKKTPSSRGRRSSGVFPR